MELLRELNIVTKIVWFQTAAQRVLVLLNMSPVYAWKHPPGFLSIIKQECSLMESERSLMESENPSFKSDKRVQ